MTKFNEKKFDSELQEAFNIKKVKSEAIGKLKELAEELAELSKNSKRLSNEEETFKLDEARKFRDAIKNIQALQYKVLTLANKLRSSEGKIVKEAKKALFKKISAKKAIESNEPEDTNKPHEERKLTFIKNNQRRSQRKN